MITRYYKTTRYLGVKHTSRDTLGEYRKELTLQTWYGRPYNRYDWDEIYEYTPELWAKYAAIARTQAQSTGREVVETPNYLFLAPAWRHRPISQSGLVTGLLS